MFMTGLIWHRRSKKDSKDQESIQSSNTHKPTHKNAIMIPDCQIRPVYSKFGIIAYVCFKRATD